MADNGSDVDEIPQKGLTVTTVVTDGMMETTVHQSGADLKAEGKLDPSDIATIHRPRSAGDPHMQHDLAVRDAHAGVYGDFSEDAGPTDSV
jgi:hypothetical protein